jgi:sugar/nucleoside kinase (ribokinase family)
MKFASKIPYENATEVYATGNASNASICASKLGLKTSIITEIGKDIRGKNCINVLKKTGVDRSYIVQNKELHTGYHYVLLYEGERTILVKHDEHKQVLPKIKHKPKWIYLSSLGNVNDEYKEEVFKYLEKNPDVNLLYQPGTIDIRQGLEKNIHFYQRSKILSVNKDEAISILKLSGEQDIKTLLVGLKNLGVETVLITNGPKGAYVFNGNEGYFCPAFPDQNPPIDRTGCGDAFTSTLLSALILGKDTSIALKWASINATSVAQKIGAHDGLLDTKEIENNLNNFKDFNPIKI